MRDNKNTRETSSQRRHTNYSTVSLKIRLFNICGLIKRLVETVVGTKSFKCDNKRNKIVVFNHVVMFRQDNPKHMTSYIMIGCTQTKVIGKEKTCEEST